MKLATNAAPTRASNLCKLFAQIASRLLQTVQAYVAQASIYAQATV